MPLYATNRLDLRSPQAFAESARLAEQLGYGAAFIPSSPLLVADPYVMLDRALAATRNLRLGPLVENPVTRHPAVIAGSISTLAQLAPGRVLLGMGVGDTAVRLLGLEPARVVDLEAAVRDIRAWLAGESVAVDAARPARVRHAASAPVWVAAQGERTLRMAGAVADGVFLRAGRDPAVLTRFVAKVREGEQAAGRPLGSVGFSLLLHTVLDDDEARAAVVARSIAAGYYEYAPRLFALAGLEWNGPAIHDLRTRVWPDFHHAADLYAAGEVVSFLPEAAASAFALYGNAQRIREQLRAVLAIFEHLGLALDTLVLHPVPTRHGPAEVASTLERFAALRL